MSIKHINYFNDYVPNIKTMQPNDFKVFIDKIKSN